MPDNAPSTESALPDIADIRLAVERIEKFALRTPILEAPLLNRLLGGRLLVKAECLQKTGSFKFRGATNRIRALLEDGTSEGGVVAFSSGNHAQGVAAAAMEAGIPAVIVMPSDAPTVKIENTKAYGAEVVTYDRIREDRAAIAGKIASERGATLIPPFDDPWIIAGQGTVGLEAGEELSSRGITPDFVATPCSGGGLVSGTAVGIHDFFPDCPVYAVEPCGFDSMGKSLEAGASQKTSAEKLSICDALMSPLPGTLPFAISKRHLKAGVAISDEEAMSAMRIAFAYLKIVAEPGGAAALAAVLSGKLDIRGKTAMIVVSGGNVDGDLFRRVLEQG